MKSIKLLLIIGAIVIMFILFGCVNKSFFEKELDEINLTERTEYEIYIMPDHIRGAISRVVYVDDIIQDDTYICEGDTCNYAILKTKNENKFLFILYEKEDGRIISSIYTDKFYNEKDIIEFEIGTPITEICEKLNISNNSSIGVSGELYLYLYEGGYYAIQFDNNSNVVNIDKFNDEYGFMDLLKESHDFDMSQLLYK